MTTSILSSRFRRRTLFFVAAVAVGVSVASVATQKPRFYP
jgi:hypothetical protein